MKHLADGADAYDLVLRIANEAKDAESAWGSLVGFLKNQVGEGLCVGLSAVEITKDVARVNSQLTRLFRDEVPDENLEAFYFGLFDAASQDPDGKDTTVVGYYVSGIEYYDDEDSDNLCRPAWWPEGRYLGSEALEAIKRAEVVAKVEGEFEASSCLSYGGQLGAALIVSRFAMEGLEQGRLLLVGFDSGDHAVLRP
ncbi:MAG: hypothetical protein V3W41_15820 [Planctomycetota bacterium]